MMSTPLELWNGVEVDTWSSVQTRRPKPKHSPDTWHSGYALMNVQWYDLGIPEIPLNIRYESFKRRLESAINRAP